LKIADMDDLQDRLIQAAIRPLGADEETKLAATQLLGEMIQPDGAGAEQAIARWDAVDQKKRKPVWRMVLLPLVATWSALVLALSFTHIMGFIGAYQSLGIIGSSNVPKVNNQKPGRKNLTVEERLILYGDEERHTKADKAKGIWDRHPNSAAYFSQYVEAYLSENGKLPTDFLITARRLDPQNAWFTYVAAGVAAKDCIKTKPQSSKAKAAREPKKWEILDQKRFDQKRFDQVLALIHEARTQPSCDDYKFALMREKIPLLEQGNTTESLASISYFAAMTASDLITMRKLGEVIATKAALLALAKKPTEFRELMADAGWLSRKTLSMEPSTLVAGLVFRGSASDSSQGLASGAKELGIHPEAENYQAIYDRMNEAREANRNRELLVDGVELQRKSNFFASLSLPMVSRQVSHPPEITDADLKPSRLIEHEQASIVFSIGIFLLLGICLAAAWAYRFRQGRLIRRLNERVESLLQMEDWVWMALLGILLPFIYVLIVNRLTPLGGRDFSICGMEFILPSGHFFGLFLIFLISPIMAARWRLGKKAASLGYRWGRPWIVWTAMILAAAYIILIGLVAPSASMDMVSLATLLLLPAKLWLLVVALHTLFTQGSARKLIRGAVARVIVPVYALAMLLMISLVPILITVEQHWFKQDTFMRLDPAFPASSPYEYRVAAQMQKETRQILGDEK
jgi:hypothetical protein